MFLNLWWGKSQKFNSSGWFDWYRGDHLTCHILELHWQYYREVFCVMLSQVGIRVLLCVKWSCSCFSAVICPPPPVSEFGALSYHRLKPGNISVFQDEVKFDCLLPLALIGNETARCLASRKWSKIPECRSKYSKDVYYVKDSLPQEWTSFPIGKFIPSLPLLCCHIWGSLSCLILELEHEPC